MAKKYFPAMIDNISQELTPMVATARIVKKEHPNAKVVFIGPCASKKLEAMRHSVRSDVDFVITFEELWGLFDAKNIEGMACPGGCIGGAGTNAGFAKTSKALKKYVDTSEPKLPSQELENLELN